MAALTTVLIVAACAGNGNVVENPDGETVERIHEIDALVQAGDVDEARQQFDELHRLLHTTASELVSDDPGLSQRLDNATEDLQRELLSDDVDPASLSDAVNRVLELLAQAQ